MIFSGCRRDDFIGITSICPDVVATSPANAASNVLQNQIITAAFNKEMDPDTINQASFSMLNGTIPVTGAVSYTGGIASFTPTLALASNTQYTGRLKSVIGDFMGNVLRTDYVWVFSTGPSIISPTVLSTDPAHLAAGAARNSVISVVFSEAMNPLSLSTSTFTLLLGGTPVAGVVNCIGSNASFTPSANLLSGTNYTATITIGASNMTGVPISSNYVWTFSTIAPLGPPRVDLQTIERFGIFAAAGVSSVGASMISNLDVGISPGARSSVTGFPPALIVSGDIFADDDAAPVPTQLTQAKMDLTAAYTAAEAAVLPSVTIVAGDQGGQVLPPGIYHSTSSLLIQLGDLVLDAQGDVNAVWIFQMGSTLTSIGGAPGNGNVVLSNGARSKNVFWQVGSSATIGDNTSFNGNILAQISITMNSGSTASGRMLVINGAVSLIGANLITRP